MFFKKYIRLHFLAIHCLNKKKNTNIDLKEIYAGVNHSFR